MNKILNLLDEVDIQGYDIIQKTKNNFIAKSPKGDEYKLTKTPQGNLTCTCIGFKYNGKCKHQTMVKEAFPKEFEAKVRHPMSDMPLDLMHKVLDKYDPNWTLLGSGRRGSDTFKDIDTLVDVDIDTFHKLAQELRDTPGYQETVAGDDIVRGLLNGYELDINRVNKEKQGKGAMLLYRTGPKDLNVLMRIVAIKNGWSLSEKGLLDHLTGKPIIPTDSPEEDYFKALGMPYLTPEQRQNFTKFLGTADSYPQNYRPSKETISKIADEYEKDIKAGKFRNTPSVLADRAKRTGFVSPTSYEQNLAYQEVMRRLRGKVQEDPTTHIITYTDNNQGQQSLFQSELNEFDVNVAETMVQAIIEMGTQAAVAAALGYASQRIPAVKNAIAKVIKKFSRTHDEEQAQKEIEYIKKSVKEELVDDIIKLGKELGKDYKREDLTPKGVKQLFAIKHSVSDRVEKLKSVNESQLNEGRSSAELKQLLQGFGVDPSGMSTKQMQEKLFSLYWAQEHPGEPEPDQYDPMLAHEIKGMTPDEIKSVFTSDKYVAQEKHDGLRSITSIHPDGSYSINTRGRSVKNFAFPDHSGKILGFEGLKSPWKNKTVLDGEMLAPSNEITSHTGVTSSTSLQAINSMVHSGKEDSLALQKKYGSIQVVYYDILVYDGEDVRNLDYEKRADLVELSVKQLQDANGGKLPIKNSPIIKDWDDIYEIFQDHLKQGHEGIMLKKKDMKYQDGYRSHDMLKLKGKSTVDAFISGFVPSSEGKKYENYIGGFQFSAYVDGKPRVIASVSNIDEKTRFDATVQDSDGKPTLNPSYLNRCAALIGQEFGKNGLLGSARIEEWRPDKTPEECQLTSEDIKPHKRGL